MGRPHAYPPALPFAVGLASDQRVADAVGTTRSVVHRLRLQLGLPSPRANGRVARAMRYMTANPGTSDRAAARYAGVGYSAVWRARRSMG